MPRGSARRRAGSRGCEAPVPEDRPQPGAAAAGSRRSTQSTSESPHQLAPDSGLDLDAVLARGGADPPPGGDAFFVGHTLDLVEAGDRVADVAGVVERLLALLREGKGAGAHAVSLPGRQAWRALRDPGAMRTATLGAARLRDVAPCRGFLAGGGHAKPPRAKISPFLGNASSQTRTRKKRRAGPEGFGPTASLREVSGTLVTKETA